jgi:capsular exopolysaccharide synthesis family protein
VTRLREALDRASNAEYGRVTDAAVPADDSAESALDPWQFEEVEIAGSEHPQPAALPDAPVTPETAARSGTDSADVANQIPPPLAERLAVSDKLVIFPGTDVTLVEQFRRLAAALHHAKLQNGATTVMIASAVEGEGKTLTATNLALTLSESYQRRVLLVDADLRRPSVHRVFDLDNDYGLSDTLKHVVPDGRLPLHRVSANLWIVPGGRPDPDPMGGLVSETMQQLLAEAAEQFDWVVIDTPPVGVLPDAKLLTAMIDTALLVVRASSTPYPLSARAVDAIGPGRLLGVVLNRTSERDLADGGYYYYSSYRYAYTRERGQHRLLTRFRRALFLGKDA